MDNTKLYYAQLTSINLTEEHHEAIEQKSKQETKRLSGIMSVFSDHCTPESHPK